MPSLTDKDTIRRILQKDPRWCVYALGDLTPRMFAKCQWFTPDLTLVLHDYGTSILFAHGTGSIREALEHCTFPVHLQVQPEGLDEVAAHARISNVKHMLRMTWATASRATDRSAAARSARVEGTESSGIRRLTAADVEALRRLYADGESTDEAPDFFHDSMVSDGVFFGAYESGELTAVAGTHLVSPDENVAAIGNVYTRRDRRSRGLSRAVMSAVLHELRDFTTVGLNVREDNAAAIRVYESLGFAVHCQFREALAVC